MNINQHSKLKKLEKCEIWTMFIFESPPPPCCEQNRRAEWTVTPL